VADGERAQLRGGVRPQDRPLAATHHGLGWAQTRAAADGQWPHARRIGVATAVTLLAIDLIYVPKGRIRKTYLLDAAMEAAWLLAWSRTTGSARR
jgi:hypothetical protein